MSEEVLNEVAKTRLGYSLVSQQDPQLFCDECADMLNDGYQTVGGISTIIDDSKVRFTQAFAATFKGE